MLAGRSATRRARSTRRRRVGCGRRAISVKSDRQRLAAEAQAEAARRPRGARRCRAGRSRRRGAPRGARSQAGPIAALTSSPSECAVLDGLGGADRRVRRRVGAVLVEHAAAVVRVRGSRARAGRASRTSSRAGACRRTAGAARPQHRRGRAHPRRHVVDPADDADRRVGEVEARGQLRAERGRVGLDELDVLLAAARRRAPCSSDGAREVDADDARAAARERDRVEADVALQVHNVEARRPRRPPRARRPTRARTASRRRRRAPRRRSSRRSPCPCSPASESQCARLRRRAARGSGMFARILRRRTSRGREPNRPMGSPDRERSAT